MQDLSTNNGRATIFARGCYLVQPFLAVHYAYRILIFLGEISEGGVERKRLTLVPYSKWMQYSKANTEDRREHTQQHVNTLCHTPSLLAM